MGAGRAAIDLRKWLEQLFAGIGGNSDPSVADRELNPHTVSLSRLQLGADRDLAGVGELDGVADEVDQNLTQQPSIAAKDRRSPRIDEAAEREALAPSGHGNDVGNAFDERREVELDRLAVQLVGLDLREVEDVIDDRQQVVGRGPCDRRQLALLVLQVRVKDEIEAADDTVHRSAYLVAHRCQELGLDDRRAQCRVASVGKPSFRRASLANIADEGHEHLLTGGFERIDRRLERELAAVAAPAGAGEPAPAKVLRVAAQAIEDVDPNLAVTPRDERLELLADGRTSRLVEPLGGAVQLHDRALAVKHQDRVDARRHHGALHLLAGLERSARGLRIGDVAQHHANPDHLAVALGANRGSGRFDPARPAVGQCDAMPATLTLAAPQGHVGRQRVDPVRGSVLADQPRRGLLGRQLQPFVQRQCRDLIGALIAVDDVRVEIEHEHALVHRFEHRGSKLGADDRRGRLGGLWSRAPRAWRPSGSTGLRRPARSSRLGGSHRHDIRTAIWAPRTTRTYVQVAGIRA